ncbi:hypothetical protein [Clostridiisalibacter paucivorans]|uniref:hypothetical protein n=1 Tax=Clostridiisalibacter paucivorans TaxID=408753 RepID=UPI00047BAD12|nr:hypothetical protein [Clostridiisalibacter paucivorans]
MLEYSAKQDVYVFFKPLLDRTGRFIDYIFFDASNNFEDILGIRCTDLIGKRMTDIVTDFEDNIFDLREIYFNMIPKTSKKYEKYLKELNRWYLISILSDESQYLILFISDITDIKMEKVRILTQKYG